MAGIAFFDFDNTLIHGDAGPLFGRFLVRDRYQSIKEEQGRREAQRDRRRLVARYIPYLSWMSMQAGLYQVGAVRRSSLVRGAYKALKGVPADVFYGLMDAFVDEEIPARIYPEMKEVVAGHRAEDRPCVVVTTGAEALVERALRHFPGDVQVIGCRLGERDGVLTGRVEGPLYGADKANIITAYCRAQGEAMADCYAYSDHYSDYHMLQAVGNPVCVNPRGRLERMAGERKWQVMRPQDPQAPQGDGA